MFSAIVYTSNSGYTKEYAQMLAEELGLPVYSMQDAPDSLKGASVFYLGWVMAGGVVGLKEAQEKYDVKGFAQVGMAPVTEAITRRAVKKYGDSDKKIFSLRGGFEMDRLHGANKAIMKLKGAQLKMSLKNAHESGSISSDDLITWKMLTEGYSCVCKENLAEIIAWARNS